MSVAQTGPLGFNEPSPARRQQQQQRVPQQGAAPMVDAKPLEGWDSWTVTDGGATAPGLAITTDNCDGAVVDQRESVGTPTGGAGQAK